MRSFRSTHSKKTMNNHWKRREEKARQLREASIEATRSKDLEQQNAALLERQDILENKLSILMTATQLYTGKK